MKKQTAIFVILTTIGLLSVRIDASPTLGQFLGTGENTGPGWQVVDNGIANDPPIILPGDGNGQSVELKFLTGGFLPSASVFTTDAKYQGDYVLLGGADLSVEFKFNPIDRPVDPINGGLQFYFRNGTDYWYANGIQQPVGTGVQFQKFGIGNFSNWTAGLFNLNSDAASWLADFKAVQEIGFSITGQNESVLQRFEISDVQFTVPEPETVWMILMVLASLGITFRSRLMELAGQVKARIRA